jgi:adenosine deaminase
MVNSLDKTRLAIDGLKKLDPNILKKREIKIPEGKITFSEVSDNIASQINEKTKNTLTLFEDSTDKIEQTVLNFNSPQLQEFKLSVLSKPNKIEAFIPDLHNSSDEELQELGLHKENDQWYTTSPDSQYRNWFPNPISDSDIAIVYDKNDGNIGFCSQEEFSQIYADTVTYDEKNEINYINPEESPRNEIIKATKCATGEFCLLPVGTKINTNEGEVTIKPGEAVVINERENSIYAVGIAKDILGRYRADEMNPASVGSFKLLEKFISDIDSAPDTKLDAIHSQLEENFNQIQRSVKLYNIFNEDITELPKDLKSEYELALQTSRILDEKIFKKIDAFDFNTRLSQAESILNEIIANKDLTPEQRNVLVSAVKVRLLPKTNSHQHLKGSVPKEVLLNIAKQKGFDNKRIQSIKDSYAEGEAGFANLDNFNKAYGTIASAIQTPKDYQLSVKGILEEAARQGQLTAEIRCAVLGQRDENGELLSPDDATKNIIDAIEQSCADIKKQGGTPPHVGFAFLGYRGKDWHKEEVTEHAELAIKYSKLYPHLKFGFDLAGPEDTGYKPSEFKEAYDLIKESNSDKENNKIQGEKVGVTLHAGETPTCDDIPGYLAIEEALDMGAHRIGHGVQAIHNPSTMEKLKESGATVEICGVCNVLSIPLNTEGLEKHPIQEFIKNDIPITICTDNDAISGTNVSKEYMQFLLTGHDSFMNWNAVKKTARNGIASAFITEENKKSALSEFNDKVRKIEALENRTLKKN